MTLRNLCLDCSRDQNGCWDRKDDEPLVHCSTFVSKASVTHPCPVCLDHPAPTTKCRMCGAEGAPFVVGEEASGWSRPEFQVSAPCGCKEEIERLRGLLREVEFRGVDGTCPLCGADEMSTPGNYYAGKHTPFCRLSAALGKGEG